MRYLASKPLSGSSLISSVKMCSKKIKNNELANNWNKVWAGSRYSNHNLRISRSTDKIRTLTCNGVPFFKGCKVLDAGCGDATTLLLLKKKFGIDAFGIDISAEALKKAAYYSKKAGEAVRLIEADTRVIPFQSNFFDVILSWGVIEHFDNYELAITEFNRLLKPGGTLNLIQPNKLSFGGLQRKYLEFTGRWESGSQIEFSGKFLSKVLARNSFYNIRYFAVPASPDMGFVHRTDCLINNVFKNWGHYLFVLADKGHEITTYQRTMVLIKPDAFDNGLVSSILSRIESLGDLTILRKERFMAQREKVELHHSAHLFKSLGETSLREKLIEYWLSGPMMKVLIEGQNAIDRVHDLVGNTDPRESPPYTIRALSPDSVERADKEGRAVKNLIHAPRSKKEAIRDLGIWF